MIWLQVITGFYLFCYALLLPLILVASAEDDGTHTNPYVSRHGCTMHCCRGGHKELPSGFLKWSSIAALLCAVTLVVSLIL